MFSIFGCLIIIILNSQTLLLSNNFNYLINNNNNNNNYLEIIALRKCEAIVVSCNNIPLTTIPRHALLLYEAQQHNRSSA